LVSFAAALPGRAGGSNAPGAVRVESDSKLRYIQKSFSLQFGWFRFQGCGRIPWHPGQCAEGHL